MRSAFILCLFLLLVGYSTQNIAAQACGRYYVSVSVQSFNGTPIKNASVTLKPITIDETKGEQFKRDKADPSSFSASFSEGHSFKEFHKVVVTAAGYKPAENQIKILSCQGKHIVVKLAPTSSSDSAVWQFENNVFIQAIGPDGKQLDDATLTVISGKNTPVPQEMKFGYANFDLPNGKYSLRLAAPGYLDKEIEADLTPIANFNLKVQLMPEGNNPKSTSRLSTR